MARLTTRLTPIKAIRAKCLECCENISIEVKRCESTNCPLFEYRMGKNPNRAGVGRKTNLSGISQKAKKQLSSEALKRKLKEIIKHI